MTKNEFKQGDKVKLKKYKEFTCDGELTYIDTDEIGVVVQTFGNDWLKVNFPDMPISEELHWSEVVLAEPQEIKTAFLTELQALLRKYNATIYGGLSETHNDDVIFVSIGDDDIAYRNGYGEEYANITADNIMDFDKE